MANAFFIVTLSTADAGSGPNYDVLYSTDCVSYLPAIPATVTLANVGAQTYITVPDNTQCVKLTNINSNCTNSVTSSVSITTTTTSTTSTTTTTTAGPTTTTTAGPTTTTTTVAPTLFYTLNSCTFGDPLYDTTLTPNITSQRYVDPSSGRNWVWDNNPGTTSPQYSVNTSLQRVVGFSGCP
jgi:hypothetical protein